MFLRHVPTSLNENQIRNYFSRWGKILTIFQEPAKLRQKFNPDNPNETPDNNRRFIPFRDSPFWINVDVTFEKPIAKRYKDEIQNRWSIRIMEYDVEIYTIDNIDDQEERQKRKANIIKISGLPVDCTAADLTQLSNRLKGKYTLIQKRRTRNQQLLSDSALIYTDRNFNIEKPTQVSLGQFKVYINSFNTRTCFKCGSSEHESFNCKARMNFLRRPFYQRLVTSQSTNDTPNPQEQASIPEQSFMNKDRQQTNRFNNLLKSIARSTKDNSIMNKVPPYQNDISPQRRPQILPRERPIYNPPPPKIDPAISNRNAQIIEQLNVHVKELDEKVKRLERASDVLTKQNNELTTAISHLSILLAISNENTDRILDQNNKLIEIISLKLFQDQPPSKRTHEAEMEDNFSDSSAKTVADNPLRSSPNALNSSNLNAHNDQFPSNYAKEKFLAEPLYDDDKSHVSFDVNQGQDYNYDNDDTTQININDMENLHFDTPNSNSSPGPSSHPRPQTNTGLLSHLNFFNNNNQ